MAGVIACGLVCPGVMSALVFPRIRVHLPWLMKLPERGFVTAEFLLETLSVDR